MKPLAAYAAAASFLLSPGVAAGQPTARPEPVMRADVAVIAGWLHVDRPELDYDNWINDLGFVGGGAGWYWTDNLKTVIDAGVSSSAERYATRQLLVGGAPVYAATRYRFSTRSLTIGQHYQFYRNVWFHPHVGGGLALTWEKSRREDEPAYVFDPVTRRSLPAVGPRTFPTETNLVARPYAEAGFKAYFSQRVFFRSDLRMAMWNGVDEVVLRFGAGVDF